MRPKGTGNSIKWPLKSAIAALILASASLAGAQTIQTLCSFNNTNGVVPWALTLGNDGSFYGTTVWGGITNSGYPTGMGMVFRVTTNGTLTRLAFFANTNGALPPGGLTLTLGNDGNFYGTTVDGGTSGSGTVFKVTTNGVLTTLYSLTAASPEAGLALGNDGNFYGTTYNGGIGGNGTVFQVTTNGTLTTLVSFNFTNGAYPFAALTLGHDGNFYGTTAFGGITNSTWTRGMGTVFQVTTNGTLTTLAVFSLTNGASPHAALRLGTDGNFYGTTAEGGITNSTYTPGMGTIFQVTTNGTLTTLVLFAGGTKGAYPQAGLTLGNDGNFYGTTEGGGTTNSTYTGGMGTVFRLLFTPAITVQPQSPTNNAGATVTFLISATTLTPMGYQWQKNGTNLVDGGNLSGTTTNTLSITGISDSDAGIYSVVLTNSYGSVTSSNATLTVIDPPVITTQPSNLLVLAGTNVAFGVSVTGTAPFRYQWRLNGTNLLNATSAIYSIPSVGTNNAGNYSVVITNAAGAATSSNAVLTVVLSPKSQTNYATSIATFTAKAFSAESLNYQWQKNGTNLVNGGNLSGATNSTLTIASVSDADAAIYNTVVSDATESVTTSNAVLTVNDYLFIASQPRSQTVGLGSNVTFNITVYGAPPFIYQWYFHGTPLGLPFTGTNFSSCTLTNVGANQAGNYSVEVVSSYGSLMSSNAFLTVIVPPTLALQLLAGYPLLNLNGMLSSNFVVQYSTNLAGTNRMGLLSLTNLPSCSYLFLDPAGDGEPVRFYRAFMR